MCRLFSYSAAYRGEKRSNLMSVNLGEEKMWYIHGNKYNAANKELDKSNLHQYEYILIFF